jgi:hypothetical protein
MTQLKLTLHPEKTKVFEVTKEEGFEFLDYFLRKIKVDQETKQSTYLSKFNSNTDRIDL